MRVVLTAVAACAVLVACGSAAAGSSEGTSLRIAFWEDGVGSTPDAVWTLRCDPAGGSLARPAAACKRLDDGGPKLFAPLSPKLACIDIYGGPQRARVTGTLDGRRIWANFARTDGCHIDRWAKVSPWLLPPGGVT